MRPSGFPCLAGHRVWLGNGLGQIEVLDVVSRRFSGAVKGLAGGVRALAVHPTQPVLASVGLDRYLRLHATHSRRLLAKVYCKTLPTGAPRGWAGLGLPCGRAGAIAAHAAVPMPCCMPAAVAGRWAALIRVRG